MTSPKKSLDMEKQSTLFGELSHIQKQTSRISKQLVEDIENIKRVRADFEGIQKQGRFTAEDSKTKLTIQINVFEQKIKNYLVVQKAQYMRFAGQINQLITGNKDINGQLKILDQRFQQFQKNVGF